MQVIVARIGRPHGIKGDVTVEVRTDDPDARFELGKTLLTDPPERGPLTIVHRGESGHITLLGFDGITDRAAAEALRDTLLLVDTAADTDPLDDDEYYNHDLIGLRVQLIDGTDLGIVHNVLHSSAQPILSVKRSDGSIELVPFVSQIVPDVDLAAKTVTIDPPDGMFA